MILTNAPIKVKTTIKPYVDKIINADTNNGVESIAIADYSINTEHLHVYIIHDINIPVSDKLNDLVAQIGFDNLSKENPDVSIGIDFTDESMSNNISFVWKRGTNI